MFVCRAPPNLFSLITLSMSVSTCVFHRIKRTGDHFYCVCPAWRNQNAPVDKRTCKHLREYLGDVSVEDCFLVFCCVLHLVFVSDFNLIVVA